MLLLSRRQSSQGTDVAAALLLDVAGSSLVLPSPPVRQRSKQLQQRLVQLQEQIDEQRYAAMVADVTTAEQQAAAALADPFFPTTKLQLSFGLHVIVTMGAFFALFYYAGRFLLPENKTWVSQDKATASQQCRATGCRVTHLSPQGSAINLFNTGKYKADYWHAL
jgi:NADP-dependent 3-hydroxy acid dehydrogenase YdfG